MIIKIRKDSSNRIAMAPNERMSGAAFKAFRSRGFLWSRSEGAFVFDFNEGGAVRVYAFINQKYGYLVEKTTAEELNGFHYEFENEQTEKDLKALYDSHIAKQNAEQEEKEAKKSAAENNKIKRAADILKKLRQLSNGFSVTHLGLARCNCKMSEILMRSEICKDIQLEGRDGFDGDTGIIRLSIGFTPVYSQERYSWERKKIGVQAILRADYYRTEKGSSFITGGSGCFAFELPVGEIKEKVSFSDMIKLSAKITEQVETAVLQDYFDYKNGKQSYRRSYFDSLCCGSMNTSAAMA